MSWQEERQNKHINKIVENPGTIPRLNCLCVVFFDNFLVFRVRKWRRKKTISSERRWSYRRTILYKQLLFVGSIAQLSHNMLQNGLSHWCACVKLSATRGGIAPSWGAANLLEEVSRDMGHRNDNLIISRDMGATKAAANWRKLLTAEWTVKQLQ